jgi:hypothetical protein
MYRRSFLEVKNNKNSSQDAMESVHSNRVINESEDKVF